MELQAGKLPSFPDCSDERTQCLDNRWHIISAHIQEFSPNTPITKQFVTQQYNGTICGFNPSTGWYHILYEDGDAEDMTKEEIPTCLTAGTSQSPANKLKSHFAARPSVDTQHKGPTSSQNQVPKPPTSILKAATKGDIPKLQAGGAPKSLPL